RSQRIPPMHAYIQKLVYSFGAQVVADYDQGQDSRLKDDPVLTGNGWCFGMSVQWCIAMQNGADFWTWLHTSDAVAKIRFLMARQRMGSKIQNVLAGHGLAQTAGDSWLDQSQAGTQYLKSHGLSRLPTPISDDVRIEHKGSSTIIRDKLT